MAEPSSALRKRRPSDSPDLPTQDNGHAPSLSNKRRFVLDDQPQQDTTNGKQPTPNKRLTNSLDILAEAASLVSPLPTRRRKRVVLNTPSPPPSPREFNLLTALASHVDILLQITSYLPPQTLLNLYSVSAPFHYVMDSHFTAFIKAATTFWAPNADKCFPWWCYRQLCIEDPALRRPRHDRRSVSWDDLVPKMEPEDLSNTSGSFGSQTSSGSDSSQQSVKPESPAERKQRMTELADQRQHSAAPVPGFRWLKMVAYRESVCREIVGWMCVHGHRIPRTEGVEALRSIFPSSFPLFLHIKLTSTQRMWFLLDIPVNGPRISLIHNTVFFPKEVLAVLQLFFIKLDMLYTDPIHWYGGECSMRELLLAERSLSTLWNYLRGADGTSKLDTLRLWIRHRYIRPAPARPMTKLQYEQYEAKAKMPICGVPAALVGRWGYECWGLGEVRLFRPDQLVIREAVRRRMGLQRMFLSYLSYGYLDGELNALPTVVEAEDVVLSMMRRKKNRELKDKEEDKMDVDG
ncbi:unnamed protein product [Aureobasidium vineae]|uniref:F-box domain-containing protein n=1 Tax=Aureobasidium vineae TaxID=2773715 RepID=A0A9N8JNB2_9PEZI|nr:unnamed protein product [Aureobasidium vineae]